MGACSFLFIYAYPMPRFNPIPNQAEWSFRREDASMLYNSRILISRLDLLAFFAIAQRQMSECALNIFLHVASNIAGQACNLAWRTLYDSSNLLSIFVNPFAKYRGGCSHVFQILFYVPIIRIAVFWFHKHSNSIQKSVSRTTVGFFGCCGAAQSAS